MVDIQSAAAEIRRGKRRRRKYTGAFLTPVHTTPIRAAQPKSIAN